MNKVKSQNDATIIGRSLISHIRSAYAHGDSLLFRRLNSDTSSSVKVKIISFNDGDLRDINIDRKIELLFSDAHVEQGFYPEEKALLTLVDKKQQIEILCTFESRVGKNVVFTLPKEGTQKVSRVDSRLSLENDDWTDGLILSNTHSVACVFKVNNFSESGIGIQIITSCDLDAIGSGLRIQGDYRNDKFEFTGPYRVVRYEFVEGGESTFQYKVGLENSWEKEDSFNRASRFNSDLFLNLVINYSNLKVQANVIDVSFSGFKAKLPSKHIAHFMKGLVVTEQASLLKFVIVRRTEFEIGFKLIPASASDRIKWVNTMIPSIENGKIDVSVSDPRDLLNLFFEAGASVVDGLAYKRHGLIKRESLSILTEQSDALIRWVNVSESGTLLGHHSTYRVGLNSWYTGDVVGGQSLENRVDRDFFNKNFKFLKEIIETFPSTQKILGSWKPNHPYWQAWRNYLIDNNFAYTMLTCDSVSRSQIKDHIENEKILKYGASLPKISNSDMFGIISSLSEQVRWFLGSLDVAQTEDYFDGLKSVYERSNKGNVKRECRLLRFNGMTFFVLLYQLPSGVTINPNFDTAFIFPLKDEAIDRATLEDLYSFVVVNAARIGFRLTSIRFFSDKVSFIGTLTEFFVTDSRGLGVFK